MRYFILKNKNGPFSVYLSREIAEAYRTVHENEYRNLGLWVVEEVETVEKSRD